MQKICMKRGIDYDLAHKSFHVLANDTKLFFRTIDEFLYTKVYKHHTIKTVFEGAYAYIICDRQEIRNQWTRVKEDWELLKNILGNRYASEKQYTKEQYIKKTEHTTIDDYVNTADFVNVPAENERDIPCTKKQGYTTRTENKSDNITAPTYKFSPAYASEIITAVQKYRGKSLEKVQSYLESKMQLHESLESTLIKAMQYRVQEAKMQKEHYNTIPSEHRMRDALPPIRFTKELLSRDMQEYITTNYVNSSLSIHELGKSFENTYGMHISTATFSKYARALIAPVETHATPVRSRREARMYASQSSYLRQEQISPTIAAA